MILAAVDIEGCAAVVVDVAGQLALDLGLPLQLFTACVVPGHVPDQVVLPGAPESVHDRVAHEAERALEGLGAAWAERGVSVTTRVRFGQPAEVVLAEATTQRPRFLVLGTHGRTGLQRWVFGSVEENIVRRCPVPVVVVPSPGTVDHASETLAALRAEEDG
jgi:nucleotide-binding universal stress UspA family protein